MSMNEIIRQRRKKLDFTQEQVAQQLGVSIPAVSKWESGATYPDVELLPALARVLKIDVNTLLCFQMELSETEIGQFITKVSEIAISEGIEQAFILAEQKIREYPTDVKLIHLLALTLQGTMMMKKVSDKNKERYELKIQRMYEIVGNSGNSKYADQSNYMLASRAISEEKYEYAQELIDRLPEYSALDKKLLQANLWMETGKEKEAEKIYASRALFAINQIQMPLGRLIEIAVRNGDAENASQLVEAGKALTKAFGMWEYNAYVFSFEKAMAEQNSGESIRILDDMLHAMLIPWDINNCPIYTHMGNEKHEINLGKKMLANILDEFDKSKKYDFMRNEKNFGKVLQKYREILLKEKEERLLN
ncbi:MAG: helix-turn-helix transcriptional regulator [Lachnospiraceae bacterium]|nr:helix-turn-helix transcriptional regulator [Lachnospiraceae bacterium]